MAVELVEIEMEFPQHLVVLVVEDVVMEAVLLQALLVKVMQVVVVLELQQEQAMVAVVLAPLGTHMHLLVAVETAVLA
jgi:hypothetical protein